MTSQAAVDFVRAKLAERHVPCMQDIARELVTHCVEVSVRLLPRNTALQCKANVSQDENVVGCCDSIAVCRLLSACTQRTPAAAYVSPISHQCLCYRHAARFVAADASTSAQLLHT